MKLCNAIVKNYEVVRLYYVTDCCGLLRFMKCEVMQRYVTICNSSTFVLLLRNVTTAVENQLQ